VTVEAFDADDNLAPIIAPEFQNSTSTPLEVDTAKIPLDIKVKKPAK
jgi:hypothetical protein